MASQAQTTGHVPAVRPCARSANATSGGLLALIRSELPGPVRHTKSRARTDCASVRARRLAAAAFTDRAALCDSTPCRLRPTPSRTSGAHSASPAQRLRNLRAVSKSPRCPMRCRRGGACTRSPAARRTLISSLSAPRRSAYTRARRNARIFQTWGGACANIAVISIFYWQSCSAPACRRPAGGGMVSGRTPAGARARVVARAKPCEHVKFGLLRGPGMQGIAEFKHVFCPRRAAAPRCNRDTAHDRTAAAAPGADWMAPPESRESARRSPPAHAQTHLSRCPRTCRGRPDRPQRRNTAAGRSAQHRGSADGRRRRASAGKYRRPARRPGRSASSRRPRGQFGMTAVASISSLAPTSTRPATCTSDMAG